MYSNLIDQLEKAGSGDKLDEVLKEVPRVREEFGYPPLVTPTSQIVGTQAVFNVIGGERYKIVTKESKALLRGEHGRLPAAVDEDVRKCIGDDRVITGRSADEIAPEIEKYRKSNHGWSRRRIYCPSPCSRRSRQSFSNTGSRTNMVSTQICSIKKT